MQRSILALAEHRLIFVISENLAPSKSERVFVRRFNAESGVICMDTEKYITFKVCIGILD